MRLQSTNTFLRTASIVIAILVVLGCTSPTGDEDTNDNGSISLRVYSEAIDPADITDDSGIEPIVQVTPAINDQTVFVGDGSGFITITDVPAGTYTVHPTFSATSLDAEITVVNGQQTTETIKLPETGLYYFAVNTTSSTILELKNESIRTAMAEGIDRQDLIDAASQDETLALDLIPPPLKHDGISTDELETITETASPTAIKPDALSSLSFGFLHNETEANYHARIAQEFKSQLSSINSGIDVTISSVDWDTYLQRREDDDYEMIRAGWLLDANNVTNYLQTLAEHANFTSSTLTTLVEEAETALDAGDLTTYTEKAMQIHDHLLSEMPVIPVYYY